MGDRVGPGLGGDLDLALGDQRAGDGGAEQVLPLVQRVGAEHREDEIAREGLAQVVHVDLLDAEHLGLLAGGFKFLALAEVGGEGHHLAFIGGLQPAQDHAGVEPPGIGEHDLFHILYAHGRLIPSGMAQRSARAGRNAVGPVCASRGMCDGEIRRLDATESNCSRPGGLIRAPIRPIEAVSACAVPCVHSWHQMARRSPLRSSSGFHGHRRE